MLTRNPNNEASGLRKNEKVLEPQGFFESQDHKNLHLYTNRAPIYARIVQLRVKDSVQKNYRASGANRWPLFYILGSYTENILI